MTTVETEKTFTFLEERVNDLLPKLVLLAEETKPTKRKNGWKDSINGEVIGYRKLASIESKILKSQYPDDRDEEDKEYITVVKRVIPSLKAKLRELARTEQYRYIENPLLTTIKNFGDDLSFLFSPYNDRINKRTRDKSKERTEVSNRVEIDLTTYLHRANHILNQIMEDDTDVDWRDVSCAIALCTGRRMSEVHLSGEFKKLDDYRVSFTGQLKGKSKKIDKTKVRYHEFEIPTLVKSDLIIHGLKWLGDKGKRLAKSVDTQRVNDKYSKVLSGKVKEQWMIFESDSDEYNMTYHKFRACYFIASFHNVGDDVETVDYDEYAQQILGDDASTVKVYKKFKIKDDSITRI